MSKISVKESTLDDWRGVLSEYAKQYKHLYVMADTETTNASLIENGKINRVLELSLLFCYITPSGSLKKIRDADDRPIKICEPLNPWLESIKTPRQRLTVKSIHMDAVATHGITQEYLMGNVDGINRPALKRPAVTFDVLFDAIQRMLSYPEYLESKSLIHLMFYNAPFDASFLNSEMEMFGYPPIESFFLIDDVLPCINSAVNTDPEYHSKKKISLDKAYGWAYKNYPEVCGKVDRSVHTASVDTEILFQTYSAYLEHIKKNNN